MTAILSQRALNRATLARQLLLERSRLGVLDAVEQLAGMQSQSPHGWYVGLWSRLDGFDPTAASTALEQRRLVRLALMRSTVHLVTDRDALWLRPTLQATIERQTMGTFGRRLRGADPAAVSAAARQLTTASPMTPAALGRALANRRPQHDAEALANGVRAWLPMVQVPPRGAWQRAGSPQLTPLDKWLGRPLGPPDPDALVRRYLAAFGPATAADVRAWSGISGIGPVLERLRPELLVFRDETGHELFDLPDAPRPAPDTPAPARFLYDYDNLLLSHADRTRFTGGVDLNEHGFPFHGNRRPSALLLDGEVAGTWSITTSGDRDQLVVRPFHRLSSTAREEVEREGLGLVRFLHPGCAGEVATAASD